MTRLVFWLSAWLVGYTYVCFPLIVLGRAVLRPRPHRRAPITPSVSVLMAARNEADVIGAKIDNLLALDYPADRLEIVLASDGSEDHTVVRAGSRVRALDLPRVGKAAALNAAAAAAQGDVLVFTDANSMLEPRALRALVSPLADPDVGGVAGDQRYLDGNDSSGERGYWSFDRLLKRAESRGGNVISATGALYAIRRELFQPLPGGVTDDFALSTGVICRRRRLVFAPDAVAWEPVGASTDAEFERKVRVITRGLNAVLLRRELLDPREHGFYALQLLSHKLLRRLMAVPLAALGVTGARLVRRSPAYRVACCAEAAVLSLGAAGTLLERRRRCGPLLALPAYFCLVNVASLRALSNVIRGRRIESWEPRRDQ
jgi:cellulose synthase/poly-beta-1,6-N-acetylglucosamine synthase-like glycosyltransferase